MFGTKVFKYYSLNTAIFEYHDITIVFFYLNPTNTCLETKYSKTWSTLKIGDKVIESKFACVWVRRIHAGNTQLKSIRFCKPYPPTLMAYSQRPCDFFMLCHSAADEVSLYCLHYWFAGDRIRRSDEQWHGPPHALPPAEARLTVIFHSLNTFACTLPSFLAI
jgi:hypothetical protein